MNPLFKLLVLNHLLSPSKESILLRTNKLPKNILSSAEEAFGFKIPQSPTLIQGQAHSVEIPDRFSPFFMSDETDMLKKYTPSFETIHNHPMSKTLRPSGLGGDIGVYLNLGSRRNSIVNSPSRMVLDMDIEPDFFGNLSNSHSLLDSFAWVANFASRNPRLNLIPPDVDKYNQLFNPLGSSMNITPLDKHRLLGQWINELKQEAPNSLDVILNKKRNYQ